MYDTYMLVSFDMSQGDTK